MPLFGSTQRTNTSRTNQKQISERGATGTLKFLNAAGTASNSQTSLRTKHSAKRISNYLASKIWILIICGSCGVLFGMRIFSAFLHKSKNSSSSVAASSFHQSPFSTSKAAVAGKTATATNDCLQTPEKMEPTKRKNLEERLKRALWSFFAGDALSSPTHWYYGGKSQVVSEYGHPIQDYTKPNKRLSGSILNKSDPNGGGRTKSILFGGGSAAVKDVSIIGDVINHGKLPFWAPGKSYHYHLSLQRGEITLEASIARVLMKSIVANGGKFDADHFRTAYMKFMQTPGSHNDTYASTCHRMFFANLVFRKLDPKDCPDNDQHNVDTIDGLVLPTITALASVGNGSGSATASATACAGVTRRSSVLGEVAGLWSKVVLAAFADDNPDESPSSSCFSDALSSFAEQTIRRRPNARVKDASTMSACYLGQSLPGLVDMVAKYSDDSKRVRGERVWEGLLANANVGGENVHRGSVMGAILGARASGPLPAKLIDGLYAKDDLEKEIDAFVEAVLPKPQQVQ